MQTTCSEMPAKRNFETTKSNKVFGQSRKQPKMLRAGLYARVSTHDQKTLPMQMRIMREYASNVEAAAHVCGLHRQPDAWPGSAIERFRARQPLHASCRSRISN